MSDVNLKKQEKIVYPMTPMSPGDSQIRGRRHFKKLLKKATDSLTETYQYPGSKHEESNHWNFLEEQKVL